MNPKLSMINQFYLRFYFKTHKLISGIVTLLLIVGSFLSPKLLASGSGDLDPDFEEVLVFVRIPSIGGFEMNAIYSYENEKLYLPITELFNYLQINNNLSPDYTRVSGFLVDEDKPYIVDYNDQLITVKAKVIPVPEGGLLRANFGLYMQAGLFGRAFGIHCSFNFRTMSVEIRTDLELPAIREMRLAQVRKNIERLRGTVEVDTTFSRNYNILKPGMLEWSVIGTQSSNVEDDYRFLLSYGTEFLGGETNLLFNYNTRDGFNWRNQQYSWRFVNNENRFLRQVIIGKHRPNTISSIFYPAHSITLTNRATTYRRSYGEFVLSDFTEPDWTVELYVNSVLIDYTRSDASGLFSFNVPLMYGASEIMLKFYGPYGEERIENRVIDIPFNFLPGGDVEYVVTGSIIDDGAQSLLTRADVNVGVNRFFTLNAGFEYLSSIENNPEIPFIGASAKPIPSLLINLEYAHGVRSRLRSTYRLQNFLTVDLEYSLYDEAQEAIRFNYLEERRLSLTMPFNFRRMNFFARVGVRQNVYEVFTYNSSELVLSANFSKMSFNLSTNANWIDDRGDVFISSNLGISYRLPRNYNLRSSLQGDVTNNELLSARLELEKRIVGNGAVSLMLEENFRANFRSISATFRYDLNFAQVASSVRYGNNQWYANQTARGSFAFGSGNNVVHIDNRTVVGRGGLSIIPFLDLNHNGIRDEGEPLVSGLGMRLNGGRVLRKYDDGIMRISELEPYTSYLLELDDTGLESISWQLKHKILSIYINPNQYRKIEIPVLPMGEVNGMVYLRTDAGTRGQGRVRINIYQEDGELAHSVLSETDGFFTLLGLAPGNYYAIPDEGQLNRVGLEFSPERIEFSIEAMELGDIVDGIEFMLRPKVEE